jgi:hypothetical protein
MPKYSLFGDVGCPLTRGERHGLASNRTENITKLCTRCVFVGAFNGSFFNGKLTLKSLWKKLVFSGKRGIVSLNAFQ